MEEAEVLFVHVAASGKVGVIASIGVGLAVTREAHLEVPEVFLVNVAVPVEVGPREYLDRPILGIRAGAVADSGPERE